MFILISDEATFIVMAPFTIPTTRAMSVKTMKYAHLPGLVFVVADSYILARYKLLILIHGVLLA